MESDDITTKSEQNSAEPKEKGKCTAKPSSLKLTISLQETDFTMRQTLAGLLHLEDSNQLRIFQANSEKKIVLKGNTAGQQTKLCLYDLDLEVPMVVFVYQPVTFQTKQLPSNLEVSSNKMTTVCQSEGYGTVFASNPIFLGTRFWEVEIQCASQKGGFVVGVCTEDFPPDVDPFQSFGHYWGFVCDSGDKLNEVAESYSKPCSHGDTIGIFLNMAKGELIFFRNKQSLGVAFSEIPCIKLFPCVSLCNANSSATIISSGIEPM